MMEPIIGLESIRPKAEQETKPMLGYTATHPKTCTTGKMKAIPVLNQILVLMLVPDGWAVQGYSIIKPPTNTSSHGIMISQLLNGVNHGP